MPLPLESLAVWPVVAGLMFILRSPGVAYNEVVVALLDQKGSTSSLQRFTLLLGIISSGMHLLIAATPLAVLWFSSIAALPPVLVELARVSFWLALPMPVLSVLQSWYQGAILHGRQTRGIPESVVVFMTTVLVILWIGIAWGSITGIYIGVGAFVAANLTQTAWLWLRARPILRAVRLRDKLMLEPTLA